MKYKLKTLWTMNADPETFLPIYKEELFINDNLVKTAIYNVHHLCDEKCSNEVLFQHLKSPQSQKINNVK